MMNYPIFDVAIAGAGLGGASAAIALSQRGFKVLVLESGTFPRHKVCGEFLSSESRVSFARLGILDAIFDAGAIAVDKARIATRRGQTETSIAPSGLAISRWKLDPILWQAAQNCGAVALESTLVRGFTRSPNGHSAWKIETSRGQFEARTVLSATGRRALKWADSPSIARDETALYAGFKTHFRDCDVPRGVVELHATRGGYCGLVRVEDDLVNACLLLRYDEVARRSPEQIWDDFRKALPSLRRAMKNARPMMPWLATGNVAFERFSPLHRICEGTADNNHKVLCCGDAAGYIHPLTGDGMAMAVRGGELAAACLSSQLRGELSEAEAAALYKSAWHREFDGRLRWAARFQNLLIHPRRAAPALALLNLVPPLARQTVRLTRSR